MSGPIVDLFAGAGGWDLGARAAGLPDPLGIEWGDRECVTRIAAGLPTLQGDVGQLDPRTVVADYFGAYDEVDGLLASPPCQAWSMAGSGRGRTHDVAECEHAARDIANGHDTRSTRAARCVDHRSILVVEPLRWTLALRPKWVAWEQVPPVLDYWRLCGEYLRRRGYTVWVDLLSTEQYGVPQTRLRAILLAARDGRPVGRPAPTHRRYLPPRRLDPSVPTLFDPAPLARPRVHPEDHNLLPWVSMAQALDVDADLDLDANRGAGMVERHGERTPRNTSAPAPVVTAGEGRGSGPRWTFASSHRRANGTVRDGDEPAPTITGGNDQGDRVIVVDTGNTRSGTRDHGRGRDAVEPSVSLTSRADQLEVRVVAMDQRQQRDPRTGIPAPPRSINAPAPTVAGASSSNRWITERPATTVAGDSRIHPPGHKRNAADEAAGRSYDGRAGTNALRVSLEQAAALQTFPAGYPWFGPQYVQFRQVGNAVPPLFAEAILRAINPPTKDHGR